MTLPKDQSEPLNKFMIELFC